MTYKLTVIDQLPIQNGSADNRPAPQLSGELAKACEQAGYERYWFAEHHNTTYFSGPNPGTMISHIASITKNMRIGSGGVMISHYSPYMIAEQFRLLSTLFPDRIDLGIGRAPGGNGLASQALAYPANPTHGEIYSRQALDLKNFLEGRIEKQHPFSSVRVSPYKAYNPELWMLGTSGGSAILAGYLGYNLSLGLFVAPTGQKYNIIEEYLSAFEKAGHQFEPKVMIAIGAYCADTTEEAEYIAGPQLYKKTSQQSNDQNEPWITPDQAIDKIKQFSESEHRYFNLLKESFVIGSPKKCAARLKKLKAYWKTNEFAFLTVTHDFESRLKSYELLAQKES